MIIVYSLYNIICVLKRNFKSILYIMARTCKLGENFEQNNTQHSLKFGKHLLDVI